MQCMKPRNQFLSVRVDDFNGFANIINIFRSICKNNISIRTESILVKLFRSYPIVDVRYIFIIDIK